jgi:hypothetical protein
MSTPTIPTKLLLRQQKEFDDAFPPIVSQNALELCLQLKQIEHRYSVFIESKFLLEFDIQHLKNFFETFSIDFDITTIEYIKSSQRCVLKSYISLREALLLQEKTSSFSIPSTIDFIENE